MEKLQEILKNIVSERTGQSVKKISSDIIAGYKWISAEYGIAKGYADELIKNTRTYRKKRGIKNEK
mgnify:CR=1 FL=1